MPKAIKNAPILLPGLAIYLVAFHRLHTCRAVSFGGVAGISWISIMEYCDRLGIDDQDQRDDMEYHIGELDGAYQEWLQSQRKK